MMGRNILDIVKKMFPFSYSVVSGGMQQVDEYEFDEQEGPVHRIREGDRLLQT